MEGPDRGAEESIVWDAAQILRTNALQLEQVRDFSEIPKPSVSELIVLTSIRHGPSLGHCIFTGVEHH